MKLNDFLCISPEVHKALEENRPVVALESTIICHGMPYPKNFETAMSTEKTVKENGAVPATVAIMEGKLCVGLSPLQIDFLAKNGPSIAKVSRADIPVLVAEGKSGATTVAATMIIAKLAGVKVFATGGIGGAHKDAQNTMDISADLDELARTNMTVVCAGPKTVLDLPLTLEYLETRGVPFLGYQTDVLPGFYTRESALKLNYRVDTPAQIAKIMKTKSALGISGSILVANPIPKEYALPSEYIDAVIDDAQAQAVEHGVSGKKVTPYLLEKIHELSGGRSLSANIQLVFNNAKLAAQIAAEYCKL